MLGFFKITKVVMTRLLSYMLCLICAASVFAQTKTPMKKIIGLKADNPSLVQRQDGSYTYIGHYWYTESNNSESDSVATAYSFCAPCFPSSFNYEVYAFNNSVYLFFDSCELIVITPTDNDSRDETTHEISHEEAIDSLSAYISYFDDFDFSPNIQTPRGYCKLINQLNKDFAAKISKALEVQVRSDSGHGCLNLSKRFHGSKGISFVVRIYSIQPSNRERYIRVLDTFDIFYVNPIKATEW